jgi:hypothetical protein
MFGNDRHRAADVAIAELAFGTGQSFNTFQSILWARAVQAIAAAGKSYKPPSYHALRTELLDAVTQRCKEAEEPCRKELGVTGGTLAQDGWTDVTEYVMLRCVRSGACAPAL